MDITDSAFHKIMNVGVVVNDTGDKLSPVSLIPAINYRRWHCYRRLIIAGVVVTGKNLITCDKDTGD